MQISICMMVKDEEENIKRCLDSVIPILQNLESELIVVDTGSKDNTVDIVRKYTDKVYFYKWEDDFSGMRNKSISYAKGKWILIIDADEEITDCYHIISFLKSPKSEPFNTGLLDVKNLCTFSADSKYAMLKSPRLFKNDGDFHYEGIVHNNPIFKSPTIDLDTTIIHYGYVEENEEVSNKKFIRTSTLLIRALEKEPENIYYLFQLSVTYRSHKDYDQAYETAKKAYKLLLNCKNKKKYKYVYYQMMICHIDFEEYASAKDVCGEGLKIDPEYIDLVFYLAKTQGLVGAEYEEAIETYKKYISLCKSYNNLNINFDVSLGMYTLGKVDEALQDIVKIYFKLKKFGEIFDFVFQIEKESYIMSILETIIKSAIKSKKLEYLKKLYEEKIVGDEEKEKKFFLTLETYGDNEVFQIFSVYDNDYSKLYLLRYKYNKDDSRLKNIINDIEFKEDFNKLNECFGDVIYYKLKYCDSLSNLLLNVWNKTIYRYMNYISKKYKDFSDIAIKYINYFEEDNSFNNLRINKVLYRYVLLIDKIELLEYEKIFKNYIQIGIECSKYTYNKEIMKDEYIKFFNDVEDKFFIYISLALENKKDKGLYIKYLRKSLEFYPSMKKGIEILKNEFLNNEKIIEKEFTEYKVQVKNTIQNLVEKGNLIEAQKLIKEYEIIVKEDIEIYSMKAIIAIVQGKIKEAEVIINDGLKIDDKNLDLLYNLAYIYEQQTLYLKALETYENIVFNMEDSEQRQKIIEYLNELENKYRNIIQNQLKNIKYDKKIDCKDMQKRFNLHLMYDSQYCDAFIHFVNKNFSNDEHKFIIIGSADQKFKFMNVEDIDNVEIIDLRYDLNKLLTCIEECSEIFVHYLFDYFCQLTCKFNINKPINWVCWGGDFYNYIDFELYDTVTKELLHELGINVNKKINKNSIHYIYRKKTLRKISKILISNEIDFDEIKEKFITNARCSIFTYPNPVDFKLLGKSNTKSISNKYDFKKKFKYLILLGNSANPSNNHIEILHELKKLNSKDFAVIVPLSYGGYDEYVNKVIKKGKELLGNQFISLTEYIQSEEYFQILKNVDVAIFNHNRQQGRGNIRILLYLGKKVYVKNTNTTYSYFKNIGLILNDISKIKNKEIDEIIDINDESKIINKNNIDLNFSPERCFEYAKNVFKK